MMMTRLMVITAMVLAGSAAHAAEQTDWQVQFKGLSGVSISCVRTIKKKYASRVCNKLKEHAATKLSKAKIPHEVGETIFSKSKDTAPVPLGTMDNALNLIIHVRATDPGPLGMDVRVNASVSYKAAVESGTKGSTPRSGELLLWQTGATAAGTGGTKKLERAMTGAIKKRMNGLLDLLEENWSR